MGTEMRTAQSRHSELMAEFPLRPLKSEADLDRAVQMLNRLLDIGKSARSEDEDDYMQVLGSIIGDYEDLHWPMPSDLEEREILQRHHEAWLAANPDPDDHHSNGAS